MKITIQSSVANRLNAELNANVANGLHAEMSGILSRGIRACEINSAGHLIFTLTDNSTVDLGVVCGVGIDGVSINAAGQFVIAYTDGTSETIGNDFWTAVTALEARVNTATNDAESAMRESVESMNAAQLSREAAEASATASESWAGRAAVSSRGLYAFTVDGNGHLIVTAADSDIASDFSIDADGHLVRSISGEENDLGLVRGSDGRPTAFTVVLPASGWLDNAQTVSNALFVASGYAYTVAPADASFAAYATAAVRAQAVETDGSCTFYCATTPTTDLTVNVLRVEVVT